MGCIHHSDIHLVAHVQERQHNAPNASHCHLMAQGPMLRICQVPLQIDKGALQHDCIQSLNRLQQISLVALQHLSSGTHKRHAMQTIFTKQNAAWEIVCTVAPECVVWQETLKWLIRTVSLSLAAALLSWTILLMRKPSTSSQVMNLGFRMLITCITCMHSSSSEICCHYSGTFHYSDELLLTVLHLHACQPSQINTYCSDHLCCSN